LIPTTISTGVQSGSGRRRGPELKQANATRYWRGNLCAGLVNGEIMRRNWSGKLVSALINTTIYLWEGINHVQ